MPSDPSARILLVDDEPSLVRMMATFLERYGYEVAAFTSTDKAWAHAQADTAGFAVAVLDATMPGLGAEELALKLLAADPKIRIIAASGYPGGFEQLRAAQPERVTFLHKPFPPASLAETVRNMIAE